MVKIKAQPKHLFKKLISNILHRYIPCIPDEKHCPGQEKSL